MDVVIAAAKGIAQTKDATLLVENGGVIYITKGWGKRLLGRMGFVKCKCITAAKKASPEEFEEVKLQFLEDIETASNKLEQDSCQIRSGFIMDSRKGRSQMC